MKLGFKQKLILVSILLFLSVGAFFMVNVELPPWSYLLSSINVLLFAVPVFIVAKNWLGLRNAVILFAALGAYALLIETNAIITGFPYGHFGYSELLGYKLFGYVPWTVAFAWTPLALAAFATANQFFKNAVARVFAVALILVSFDLVLDPGAVRLGFWQYKNGGFFYGVPFINFVGWAFSGLLGGIWLEILLKILKPVSPVPAQFVNSTFFIIFFWSMISLFGGMWIPAIIGLIISMGLFVFHQKFGTITLSI